MYLDSLDRFYSISHEQKAEPKTKKRDYSAIGALVFGFSIIGIVIALTVYTALKIFEVIN